MDLPPLKAIICKHIQESGPMPLDEFMSLCLYHGDHGFYTTHSALGAEGAFTTAPEISQVFGEMIGIWCASQWMSLGQPQVLNLVELGPGRGTLMCDLLRGTKHIAGFHQSLRIHMIEISPRLRQTQKDTIEFEHITWAEDIDVIENDLLNYPTLYVGNEFLDALPIKQYMNQSGIKKEVCVDKGEGGDLEYCYQSINDLSYDIPEAGVLEINQPAESIINKICQNIKHAQGAGLFIDYGYKTTQFKDTFQALKAHQYADPLRDLGACDLTAHVNFGPLLKIAMTKNLRHFYITQKQFLTDMKAEARLQGLLKSASEEGAKDLLSGYGRITEEMGGLFKVMAIDSFLA